MLQMNDVTHRMIGTTHELQISVEEMRDHIADFDDFFRPIRNYFYWEPHCFDIPICFAIRSIFDTMDGVDQLTDKIASPRRQPRRTGCAHAAAGRPVPADDREHADHADHDADDAQHHVRDHRDDERIE